MMDKSNHRHKTIGILIDWTVDHFQQTFLDGVFDFSKEAGISCIIFEGGRRSSPREYEAERSMVFQLASDKVVDGLVIFSASIGLFGISKNMQSFCEQFRPMPLISVSMEIGNVSSILFDNRRGMRELITHLTDRHGYRRFAFVKGPEGNQDSAERMEICEEVLRERGISVDPRTIFPGDFTIESGTNAAKYFLDLGIQDLDVIVGLNDSIAMGVIKELERNRVDVPGQIAVTGFDNIGISGFLEPALTTVKIPIYGQGWTSAKLLLDLLEGRSVPLKTYLPTRLIVRESCRCDFKSIPMLEREAAGTRRSMGIESRSLEQQFPYIYETIHSHTKSGTLGNIEDPNQNPIQDLPEASSRENAESMVELIDGLSTPSYLEEINYDTLENMLFELWRNRTSYSPKREAGTRTEDVLFKHLMKLGHIVVQKEWNRVNEFLKERQKLELIRELLVFTEIPKQMDVLAKRLPDMGISSGYLSLYKGDPPEDRQQAVCVLGIRDLHRLGTDVEGMDFPSKQLVPDDFLSGGKQRFMIVEPLKQYGFFLFEINQESNGFAAFLGDIISGALQAALLFKQLEIQKDDLSQNLESMRKVMAGFIQTMSSMVEVRDPYTAGHQRRVSDLARTIAQQMNLTPMQIEGVRVAGIIHDLGKLYIPAEILNRAGPLDDVEWSMIKKHPKVAYDILKTIDFPWPIGDAVFQHHERLDGSGYPNGLTAEAICLEARILAVADVVEAMSSHRPYREALGEEKALEEINDHRGSLYEPAVVDACTDLFRKKGFKFKTANYFGPLKRRS